MDTIALKPDILFHLGAFPITNTFSLQVTLSILLCLILITLTMRLQPIPNKPQAALEILLELILQNIDNATGDRHKTKKLFPYIATLFFFILFCNLFTIIPGISALTLHTNTGPISIFRAVTSDYSLVLLLTLISICLAQFAFIVYQGLGAYLKQWFDFSSPLNFILGLMNIIGELAKILSLSFRLFGNMFAGEILTVTILSLAAFVAPIPFIFLSILSCCIQAFVFSLLSTIYIGQAMQTTTVPTPTPTAATT
jgi:F-type H+-transporting ATPase subunit a